MDEPAKKRRPRLSLLSLLLIVAVVALSVTTYTMSLKMSLMRAEVRALRNEVGELTIRDRSKVHAIRIVTEDHLSWKWRVWLPENSRFLVGYFTGEFSGNGLPEGSGGGPIPGGEYVVTYEISPDEVTGELCGRLLFRRVAADGSNWIIRAKLEDQSWAGKEGVVGLPGGVGYDTAVFDPDAPIVICDHRVSRGKGRARLDDFYRGFMLWLTPSP